MDRLAYLWSTILSSPAQKVYLYWAISLLVGFWLTQYYQIEQINWVWLGIAAVGLYLMYRWMFKARLLRRVFWIWLVVISLGMLISEGIFYISWLTSWVTYLAAIWLGLLGLGQLLTGLVMKRKAFYVNFVLQTAVALGIYFNLDLLNYQYIVAAVVSSVSMAILLF